MIDAASGGSAPLLRVFRAACGVSQRELAERVGCTRETISNIERGATHRPQRRIAEAIAAALGGIEVEVLFPPEGS